MRRRHRAHAARGHSVQVRLRVGLRAIAYFEQFGDDLSVIRG